MDMTAFDVLTPLAEQIDRAGGRAYIVGGWVRDRALGVHSKDLDIEVFGVPQDAILPLLTPFGHVEAVGAQFPVYKLFTPATPEGIDVALPRRESKNGVGHKGFDVHGDHTMTLEEAVQRRDFTINALAFDPITGDYIDHVGGLNDIHKGVIRVVNPQAFADDSLRVLRAVQFAARFGFTLDGETELICRNIDLSDLPAERIWGEVEKLLKARTPSIGLEWMMRLGVLARLFPELLVLQNVPQDPTWHPEGNVWIHTKMVVDQARANADDLLHNERDYPKFVTLMLAALVHDVGKFATTELIDGRVRAHDHEAQGVAPASMILDTLNIHTLDGYNVRAQVLALVENHLKPMLFHKEQPGSGAFRRLARKVDMDLLGRLAFADISGRGHGEFEHAQRAMEIYNWFRAKSVQYEVHEKPVPPLLMGRHLLDLGLKPGPHFRVLLDDAYERQMDGEINTFDDAIAYAKTRIVTSVVDR
jgi:tRNA nucleotidyltransferase (CCA-adding enzyme)